MKLFSLITATLIAIAGSVPLTGSADGVLQTLTGAVGTGGGEGKN
jgi:hypothetical protein